jgi:hypothetical protein
MEAVLQACSAQRAQLSYMAENLPAHLPGPALGNAACLRESAAALSGSDADAASAGGSENNAGNANAARPSSADAPMEKKRRPPPPRRHSLSHL